MTSKQKEKAKSYLVSARQNSQWALIVLTAMQILFDNTNDKIASDVKTIKLEVQQTNNMMLEKTKNNSDRISSSEKNYRDLKGDFTAYQTKTDGQLARLWQKNRNRNFTDTLTINQN